MMVTIPEVVESYRNYLLHHQTLNPKQQALKRFDQRMSCHAEAARAEAITFEYLRHNQLNPRILEDAGTGGVDFECEFWKDRFVVEVTAFGDAAVTAGSGVPEDIDDFGGGYLNMQAMTKMLRSRASNKSAQLSGYDRPRVLVIASQHPSSAIVLGQLGAEEFMTGGAQISVPVGPEGATADSYMSTELREAAFIRSTKSGVIESCRRSLSAILLVAVHGKGCHVLGMRHPDPVRPLPRALLPRVPFLRVRWPIENNQIDTEWTIHDPRPEEHFFSEIEMTDGELRSGLQSKA